MRNTLGKMLGEKAQASACREIIQIVVKQMNSIDFNPENAKDCNQVISTNVTIKKKAVRNECVTENNTFVQNSMLFQITTTSQFQEQSMIVTKSIHCCKINV